MEIEWWGRRDLNSQPSGITTPEPLHPSEVVRKHSFCSGARLYAMRLESCQSMCHTELDHVPSTLIRTLIVYRVYPPDRKSL